ncbi:hypothetical protein OUZ56_028771 [Daphnia magna]|uniref:Uncharacterized protein n=1 Tax=Daphnia magna TaxID=35525 RepID=A0ABR0B4Y7_9CRUS|nr:hypothetical protein OUZ56_028771 [Daphnia magna]
MRAVRGGGDGPSSPNHQQLNCRHNQGVFFKWWKQGEITTCNNVIVQGRRAFDTEFEMLRKK